MINTYFTRKATLFPALLLSMVCLLMTNCEAFADALKSNNLQDPAFKVDGLNQKNVFDQGTANRGLQVNENDITQDQEESKINLNKSQLHQAEVWGLTPEQEQRYVFLMQNKSKIYYSKLNLSPVWILGLNARTDDERQYYAQLAAKQEQQYVAQNLAWEFAFHNAYKELSAGLPLIKPFNTAPFSPATHHNVTWQKHDVINLFLKPTDKVAEIVTNIISAQNKDNTIVLNVFFVGKYKDIDLQNWANNQSLPIDWVKDGRITLNHGDSAYEQLNIDNKETPLLLLVRNGATTQVNAGTL